MRVRGQFSMTSMMICMATKSLLLKVGIHLKNKCCYRHPPFWSADAYFEARKVLCALHVLHDATHAIVAAMTAFGTKPNFAQRQIKVIIYHQYPLGRNLHPNLTLLL